MTNPSSESWLDAQLRETPLPEAFLQRLRAIARESGSNGRLSDEAIDRLVREVPVPPALVARLRAIARGGALSSSDEALDRRLREVILPEKLTRRLRAIAREEQIEAAVVAAANLSNAELDRRLRDVAVPVTLLAGVRAALADESLEEETLDEILRDVPVPRSAVAGARVIPQVRPPLHPLARGLAAAVLYFAVGAAYFIGVAAFTSVGRPPSRPAPPPFVVAHGPLELEARPTDDALVLVANDEIARAALGPRREQEIALAEIDYSPTRGPFAEMTMALNTGRPFENAILAQWKPLGARWADDALPDLDTAPAPAPRGIEPPLVKGFDRVFLYNHGVFPLVRPGAHPDLASWSTPLTTSTASYDRTERLLEENRWPDPRDVRVEDFLAAIDYPFDSSLFPIEPDRVKIRTAAGPSVFGRMQQGLRPQLLQVAAQAGPAGSRAAPVTHLTVAVDISASMNWNGRIEMIQRALARLLDHLGPQDRLALVAFNQEVAYLVEDASREDREKLLETIHRLRPHGGTNLDAGLRQAVASSLAADLNDAARRVVLLTDGRVGLPSSEAAQIEAMVRQAAEQGLRLDLIDLSQQEAFPEYMEQLAAAGQGRVHRGDSEAQIRWTLVENLVGQSPLLAVKAALRVKFNPQAVAFYRLLGHEPSLAAIESPDSATGNLCYQQSATVLYEVWLAPGEVNDVATAELTWTDPRSGQSRREEQRISRLQFAPSLAESPLSLQAATIAAQTAEVLRGSYFTLSAQPDFRSILREAGEVNPQLAQEESFRRFVDLVERLHQLKTRRP